MTPPYHIESDELGQSWRVVDADGEWAWTPKGNGTDERRWFTHWAANFMADKLNLAAEQAKEKAGKP